MSIPAASFSLGGLLKATEINWNTLAYFLGGAGVTYLLIGGALLLGLILGTFMASLEVYGPRWSARLVALYTWFFRGVPVLVLLFIFYFGLASLVEDAARKYFDHRLVIPPFWVAVTVLGLCSAAYQSQIFRGAMQSIPAGQFKAAVALGMSRPMALRTIILPQAYRISIPAWSNEYSILLKDSAIAFVLGVGESMARYKQIASYNHQPLIMYIMAGVMYFIMTWAGVKLLSKLYDRVRIPGLVEVEPAEIR